MLYVESDLNKFRRNIKKLYIFSWIPFAILIWTNIIYLHFNFSEYFIVFIITFWTSGLLITSILLVYVMSVQYLKRQNSDNHS